MNEEFSKLVALAGANFTWTLREVSHVLEKLRNMRLGMSFPEFMGLGESLDSIKMQKLEQMVAMEIRSGRKVAIFTRWPELLPRIRKFLGKTASVEVASASDALAFEAGSVQVALVSDSDLDFVIHGLDVVMNLDHPWDKNLLLKRKSVWDQADLAFCVEYNFVVSASVEERGLIVMETLPHLLTGLDAPNMEPASLDMNNLRSLIRKLAGRREDRISSSQSVKVDRVSQRERKVVSRSKSAHDVQRSTVRGRTIISSSADRSHSPSPTSQMRRGQLYSEGMSLSGFEESVILLHLEGTPDHPGEVVFASIIDPRSRRQIGWTSTYLAQLGHLLSQSAVVVGSCSSGNFSLLFNHAFPELSAHPGLLDLQKLFGEISGETLDVRNLLEATCGRRVLWDSSEVTRLIGQGRHGDLLELGCSELRLVWDLLGQIVRESRFFCKVSNERQSYSLDPAQHFPEVLADFLQRYQSL